MYSIEFSPAGLLPLPSDWLIGCCNGVRLLSQNCFLGPIVLSPGDSDVDIGARDKLGLTPNLSIRAFWPSPETSLE
jgi:hypothetical protein